MGYTKLFSEILGSTIWREPDYVRIVWITMLAMKDERHEVRCSVPGLADFARVPREKCESALEVLSSPDADSRSQEHEGRRIEKVDGGWLILNGEKYRRRKTREEHNEYMKNYMRKYRKENDNSSLLNDPLNLLTNVKEVNTTEQIRTEQIRTNKNSVPSLGALKELDKYPQLKKETAKEAIWNLYPKKRPGDQVVFERLWFDRNYTDTQIEQILRAVKRNITSPDWIKDGGKYVPRIYKFLEEGSWKEAPRKILKTVSLED